jgi:hypothetical protein
MLRFFRNIRQKLIEQENVRKYMWYALGEILLVMIGILLALQINNWNEQRKQEQEVIRVLTDFADNIESGVLRSDPAYHLMPAIQLDSVHYHILNQSLEPDLLDNSLMADSRDLLIDPMYTLDASGWLYDENISTILENERLFPKRFSSVIFRVRRLNAAYQTMLSDQEELKAMQQENQRYLRAKEWLHKTDAESFRQRIDFFHTDTRFRNHLRSYQKKNARFIQQLDTFLKYQIFTWMEFQALVHEKSLEEIFERIESAGYQKAEEVACDNKLKEHGYASFYTWFPILNKTSKPVEIYMRNFVSNTMYLYLTIEPGEYAGAAANTDFPFLQVGTNNTCERQYAVSWDKIVVIE